jgi:hypothetical protein
VEILNFKNEINSEYSKKLLDAISKEVQELFEVKSFDSVKRVYFLSSG